MADIQDRIWTEKDPYLVWLRESKGLSKRSVYHYFTYYRHFKNLPEINQQTIDAFLQKKKNNCVARGFIKSFLEFAQSQGVFIQYTFPPTPTGRKRKKLIRRYSQDQIKIVRNECYKRKTVFGIIFDLLYYGALRRAEVRTIRVNGFNWKEFFENPTKSCELLVEGKGKKERRVLIPPSLVEKILDLFLQSGGLNHNMEVHEMLYFLENNSRLLFGNLTEFKVWKIINRTSKKVLGDPMRPHELRHSRATEMEEKGVPIRAIQFYLGHSSPTVTEIYLHTSEKGSLQEMRKFVDNE